MPLTIVVTDSLASKLQCEADLRKISVEQLAIGGVRDPKVLKKTRKHMLAMREEIYREHGLLDIGMPAIRAMRDGKDA